ncbi:phosphopantetheine-binding protein [Brevibacillus sp. TJ4]|uniref:phosphopantetheine-binding protein n=1 Tax=Brevibacillus sp. TJ4 TaxID=3234853 RepID=UPI0037D744D4
MAQEKIEQFLVHVWADAFEKQDITVDGDFFDLGGHSLLAAQLVTKIRETLKADLSLLTFFDYPTIKELAEQIGQMTFDEQALDDFLKIKS